MNTVGAGQYTYEVIDNWGKLPAGRTFEAISCVGVDSQDRVYAGFDSADPLYPRGPGAPAIMVLDREGNYLNSWGGGRVVDAHSIFIGPDDALYLTDKKEHVALKFTLDGRPLLVLGTRGQPSDSGYPDYTVAHRSPGAERKVLRAAGPFNQPTKIVTSPSGDIYVSDGDANCRVHRFSANGKLIASWGTPGHQEPYEFDRPHGIWVDRQGRVYVCDRHNNRIQIFSADGEFIDQWTDLSAPADICIDRNETVYIGEHPKEKNPRPAVRLHKGISIRNRQGKVLGQLEFPATAGGPHSLCVDSMGDIYVTGGHNERITKYVRVG